MSQFNSQLQNQNESRIKRDEKKKWKDDFNYTNWAN